MQVAAFSSPLSPDWRWRIVTFEGEMVAESYQTFPTIAAALASGTQRLVAMNVADRAELTRSLRWNSQRRRH